MNKKCPEMTGVTSLPIHTPLDPAQVINVCMHA